MKFNNKWAGDVHMGIYDHTRGLEISFSVYAVKCDVQVFIKFWTAVPIKENMRIFKL